MTAESAVAHDGGPGGAPAGLFGAALAPGTVLWNPTPLVTIAGQVIPNGPPAGGNLDGLVAIDKLSVPWGTDEPMDQPPPSTATLSLLDFTRRFAGDRDMIGLPVVLSWSTTQASRVFFRGRITDLDLTRVQVGRPDGSTVPAARLDLTCSSIEMDLANRFPKETTWPVETVAQRAARIEAYCAGVADRVIVIPTWEPGNCASVKDPNKTSVRDHLVKLMTSTGRRFIYSPERRTYEWMPRATANARGLQRLWTGSGTHPRAGLGAWVGPDLTSIDTSETGVVATDTPTPLFLDADWLEYPHGLTRQASSRITRVEVTGKDPADETKQITQVFVDQGADESLVGERTVTHDSMYGSPNYIEALAGELLSLATQEGAQWRPQRIRWDTRRLGGFPHHGQAAALLIGHTTDWPVSINGSWVAAYNVRPLFRITGGVITYHGGPDSGWDLELDVVSYTAFAQLTGGLRWAPVKQHAITFEEIDDGTDANTVRWYDTDNPNGLHESVTFEDLGHVGRGRGATTLAIGPDTGWDT